jgi:hypothetical protein
VRVHKVAGFIVGAASALALAAPALAGPVDPGTEYMLSVVAPALRADCEGVRAGFGKKFDVVFPAWKARNLRQIEASRKLLKQAEQVETDEELEAQLVSQARRFFQEDDAEGRATGCDGMLAALESTETNPPVEP